MKEASVWYAGDPDTIASFYGGGGKSVTTLKSAEGGGVIKEITRGVRDTFWGRGTPEGEATKRLHIDIARDIATISSELLHADAPSIIVEGDRELADGQQQGEEPRGPFIQAVREVQDRLDYLLDRIGWEALLLAAAETQSPLGSVALRLGWDDSVADFPFVTRIDGDAYVPEYTWGMLTAVTFWRVVGKKDSTLWYHLERHEKGAIWHALYKGTHERLNERLRLEDHPATAALISDKMVRDELGDRVLTPANVMTAQAIPNLLPDPMNRSSNTGRSDYSPAMYQLFDALDEIYTSLMRDIDLAKGRLIVADYMLDTQEAGQGATFDKDRAIFSPLKMQPSEDGEQPITLVQFAIRVEEHIRAAEHIASKIVKQAGYNPQTMGDTAEGEAAMTATEVNSRSSRSNLTRDKKIRYWANRLEDLIWALLQIDKELFGQSYSLENVRVRVRYPDSVQPDMLVLAQTVAAMKQAEAASIKVRVETLHPDWDEGQVEAEVEQLQKESTVVDPTTFGLGGRPAPTVDTASNTPGAAPAGPDTGVEGI